MTAHKESSLRTYQSGLDARIDQLLLEEIGIYLFEESPEKAIPVIQRSLKLSEPLQPDAARADLLSYLGAAQIEVGELEDATKSFESMLSVQEKVHGDSSHLTANALNWLAIVHVRRGNLELAQQTRERSLGILEKISSIVPGDYLQTLIDSGEVLRMLNRFDEAEADLKRAVEFATNCDPPAKDGLATALNELGSVHWEVGDIQRARVVFEQALETQTEVVGPDHLELVRSLSRLGLILQEIGLLEEAESRLHQALEIVEREYGEAHPEVAISMENLAQVQTDLGCFRAAEKSRRRALEIDRQQPHNPMIAIRLHNIGATLIDMGMPNEAKECLERALRITIQTDADDNYNPAFIHSVLGKALAHLDDFEAAISQFELALAGLEQANEDGRLGVGIVLRRLAAAYLDSGQVERAKETAERATDLIEKAVGPNNVQMGWCLTALGEIQRADHELQLAMDALERGYSLLVDRFSSKHPYVAEPLSLLGLVQAELGKLAAGREKCEEALRISEEALGADNYYTNMYRMNLHRVGAIVMRSDKQDQLSPD